MDRGCDAKGFTLIEIMLVVIIIGILATVVVTNFAGRSQEARVAAARADIYGSISVALDLFELDNGRYPATDESLQSLVSKPASAPNWKGPYIKGGEPRDPWNNPYQYVNPGTHNTEGYDLSSFGADGVEGGGDDITNWGGLPDER